MILASLIVAATALSTNEQPIEYSPYSIQLQIGFESSPLFPASYRSSVARDCRSLIERTIGETWSIRGIESSTTGRPEEWVSALNLASLPIERAGPNGGTLFGFPASLNPDKIFFASIAAAGPRFRVTVKEWDRLTDSFGPHCEKEAIERNGVARALHEAILTAYRPIAEVDVVDDSVHLRVKAGAIPSPDRAASTVEQGALFKPLFRQFDREGALIEIRPVPFTFFEVRSFTGSTAAVDVHSALRSPVGSRRGLVEAWAIAAPAIADETVIQLENREVSLPLAGRRVEVRNSPFVPGEDETAPKSVLLSDRSGTVVLKRSEDEKLYWLTIKSSDVALMRLPVAPGVDPSIVVPLGDDQRRRDAEGRLSILTSELIETVAKRATLLATARSRARTGRYEEAEEALNQAAKLPAAPEFRRRIAAIETPAVVEAEKAGDRVVAARIRVLGRKANDLIARYLNPDALHATREEVEELKRTDPDRVTP